VLPIEAERAKLPGFMTRWPKDEDFDILYEAYTGRYPESEANSDDVSLMVVWIGGRLPFEEGEAWPADEPEASEEG